MSLWPALIGLLFVLIPPLEAGLSLSIPPWEVAQLLGSSRELSLVRHGRFHWSAIRFTIQLAENKDKLFLAWQASDQIEYAIKITTSDPVALPQPHLNISHRGLVPTRPSTWRVSLPCSHRKSALITLNLEIGLSGSSLESGAQTIVLTRTKQCQRSSPGSQGEVFSQMIEPDRTPPHIVFASVVLAALLLALMLALIIVGLHIRAGRYIKARQGKSLALHDMALNQYQPVGQDRPPSQMSYPHGSHAVPPPVLLSGVGGSMDLMSDAESRVTEWVNSQQRRSMPHQSLPPFEEMYDPKEPEEVMAMLEIDRLRLRLGQLLQEGTFGRVYQGTLLTADAEPEIDVVVKTVVAGSSASQCALLIKEGVALQGIANNHVHTLIATTFDGTSPMLVYPYLCHGNLKKFLNSNNQTGLSTHQVVSLGLQMLRAVQHLHKRKIIHKDIATRNCVLGENLNLRLGDSALSRDLFPSDYHCLGDNENRPLKWMPIEAIVQKKYSRASDAWSFGVFMWELMTRAQQPFSDIDPFEMESYLIEGYRLHQPMNCPDQLYSALTSCWSGIPEKRASVHHLYSHLQSLQTQLQQFV
eukprot:TCALIF_03435-PA protein Name:"Similar to dnt Tyrosine-protein kinase Dnt (Drosophila melanogaster)" AED:0.21 eAED:0.21 QI:0/0/0/0.71/1/1/7/0/583